MAAIEPIPTDAARCMNVGFSMVYRTTSASVGLARYHLCAVWQCNLQRGKVADQHSSFFESIDLETRVLRKGQGKPIPSGNKAMETILLSKSPQMRRRDMYFVTIHPDCRQISEPHSSGTFEHAFVVEGRVSIGPTGKTEILDQGDYFRYPADVSHEYKAVDKQASLILVIESHF